MRRHLPLVALGAALVALAGCGVPVSSSAQVLQGVPAGLLQPAGRPYHPPVSGTRPSGNGSDVFEIYLVAGDRLVPVPRTGRPSEQLLLNDLEAGPGPGEQTEGITTFLPGGAEATIVKVKPPVVTVNLDFSVDLPVIALAEIVYTLTDLEGITKVAFYQAGGPVLTPIETGAYEPGPLTQQDYARFKPAAVAAPPTKPSHPKCTIPTPQTSVLGACP